MPFSDDLLRELLATFAVEAQEHLQAINRHLLVLEKAPAPEQADQLLAEIFREAHSLKGAARAVNLDTVGTVAHRLETLFARLRDGQIASSSALFDLVYQTLDALGLLAANRPAAETNHLDVAGLLARLDQAGAQPAEATAAPAGGSRSLAQRVQKVQRTVQPGGGEPSNTSRTPPHKMPEELPDGLALSETLTPAEVPDALALSAPPAPAEELPDALALSALPTPAEELPKAVALSAQPAPPASEAPRPHLGETTVRLSTAKLDALMEVVGELQAARLSAEQRLAELRALQAGVESWEALSRAVRRRARRLRLASLETAAGENGKTGEIGALLEFLENNDGRVRSLRGSLSDLRREFEADSRRLAQLMADLQDGVRRTRLLPISTVLDTFPRLVRDLAHELDKDVTLEVLGGETEVDRAVLEQIKDPLTHLVRNALDHGLESPAARLAAGKPASGTLTLRAAQLGDSLLIEVADDGGGIDVARVKAGAIQRGWVTAEAAGAMSEHEALWLIFRSGLSTSPIITSLSGRGVGLDVVRENVERLNGWIDVENFPGRGARFAFRLPLTVATTLCLLAQAGGQTFGLPISSVVRVVRVGAEQIGHAEGGEAIQVDARPVVLMHLTDVLELHAAGPSAAGAGGQLPAVVLGSAERRAAFVIDALGAAQEVVVKSLPQPLARVQHIAGAAILGSGEIALILNAADLLRGGGHGAGRATRAIAPPSGEAAAPAQAPVILVADDSITTRTLERNILEAAGFQVRVASDGVEAWTVLQSEPCQLLVSDVNMPRLNGFELTEKVRADEKLKGLPIILVTSLDSREDRERGIWAGADAYIVKGAFDQDVLLSTIRQLI